MSTPSPQLTQAKWDFAGTESNSYGYLAGGQRSGLPDTSTIDRLDFSNETVSAPSQKLTQARQELAAVSNG